MCPPGVPSNLGLSKELESKGDVCTWLSIAPHKRAHPGESGRKTAWVPAARLPRVVSDDPLRGALTAAAALPWGPASRRRGTDNELLARAPCPAGLGGAGRKCGGPGRELGLDPGRGGGAGLALSPRPRVTRRAPETASEAGGQPRSLGAASLWGIGPRRLFLMLPPRFAIPAKSARTP